MSMHAHSGHVFWADGFPMSDVDIWWHPGAGDAVRIATGQHAPHFLGVFDGVLVWDNREVGVSAEKAPESGLVGFDLKTQLRRERRWPVRMRMRMRTRWEGAGTTFAAFVNKGTALARQKWYESEARYWERRIAHDRAIHDKLWTFDVTRREHAVRWIEHNGHAMGLVRCAAGWAWFRSHDLDGPKQLVLLDDAASTPAAVLSRPGHPQLLGAFGEKLVIGCTNAYETTVIERVGLHGTRGPDVTPVATMAIAPEVSALVGDALWYVDAETVELVQLRA